jgi:UDP-2,3-diacylglucosamine pyrophosphatase LpxH
VYFALKRISGARKAAFEIPFDDSARFVTMSDCHRGDGDQRTDNFSKNQTIFFTALSQYFGEGYTYIEIGDGDELWENRRFGDITAMYRHIYELMSKFYKDNRLYMIYGNHDYVKRRDRYVERYYSDFFPGIRIHESIVLKHDTGGNIFVVHGHQADFLNDPLWKFARFLVRYIWRSLELMGVNDPTSAAKNYNRRIEVEKTLTKWTDREHEIMIAGHTHRPVFPSDMKSLYFNDGSCVHPNGVTAIEINHGTIALVRWSVQSRRDGTLYVGKDYLAGPNKLWKYFDLAGERKNVAARHSASMGVHKQKSRL